MSEKCRDNIFFWICFLTPFVNINPWLFKEWGRIFGPLNGCLVVFPLVVAIIYSLYLQFIGKSIFVYNKWITRFLWGMVILELITLIHGAYIFPYWGGIDSAIIPERIRDSYIGALLQKSIFGDFSDFSGRIYFFCYLLREEVVWTVAFWGGSYLVYCWYKNDYKRALVVMEKGIEASIFVLIIYCLIELFALCGNVFFARCLGTMDFVLHPNITSTLAHWTICTKQMRGFFCEPSNFGMYAGVMSSFLWYKILVENKRLAITCNLLLSFFVILASSRAAFGIYCGMLVLLFVLLLYKCERILFIRGGVILISAVVVFFTGTFFIRIIHTEQVPFWITGDTYGYLNSNLGSLTKIHERSNGARYAFAYAALKAGIEHPFLGVGKKFYLSYAVDNVPEWGKSNQEVLSAYKMQRKEPLDNIFPVYNWYCELFATRGIVGVVWYLFPFVFAAWKIAMLFKTVAGVVVQECMLFLELLLVLALWGINNSAPCLYYTLWVVLGVAFAFINGIKRISFIS